jgi:hypothetical protein
MIISPKKAQPRARLIQMSIEKELPLSSRPVILTKPLPGLFRSRTCSIYVFTLGQATYNRIKKSPRFT